MYRVFRPRCFRQRVVERQAVVNHGYLDRQLLRDVKSDRPRYILLLDQVLYVEQHADDLRRVVVVLVQHPVDLLRQFVGNNKLRRDLRYHQYSPHNDEAQLRPACIIAHGMRVNI